MKIYKYTSLISAISILKSNGVAVSNPKSFNDPNDCSFEQDEKDEAEIEKLINDYFVFVAISKLVNDSKLKLNKPSQIIFDGLKKKINVMKTLFEKHPYFDRIEGFDQIYRIMGSKTKEVNELVRKNKKSFLKKMMKTVDDAKENALISCFSKRNDSMLMWSHYAVAHRGVCIEYNRPSGIDFKDVVYQKKRPTMKLYKAVSHAIALDILQRKETEEELTKELSDMLDPFFVKSEDWKYEEEVRCLFTKSKPNDKISFNGSRYIYEMEYPTAIYIGCNAAGEDLDHLIRLANNRGIPVYFMKKSKDSFDIVVDQDYKYQPGERKPSKEITLLRLANEINRSLDSKNYFAAFVASLIIPGICSQVEEADTKDSRERYIKWCNEYLPCANRGPDNDGTAYFTGEIIWNTKEQLLSNGNVDIYGNYKDFHLASLKLRLEERNALDIYTIGLMGQRDITISLTAFSVDMIYQAERCYKKHQKEIESLSQISVEDYEYELENLYECAILTKRLSKRVKG